MKNAVSFLESVKSVKGCQFIGLTYQSAVKLNKAQTALIGGSVTKIVSGAFQFNYSYENAVNNRLERQGGEREFVAESLKWGAWVDGMANKVITHKGLFYLRFYGVANQLLHVIYYVDGGEASEEQIALIKEFTAPKQTATQTAVGLTENQVVARSVCFDNIIKIAIGGETFE